MNRKNLITVFLLILIVLCGITVCAEANETDTNYIRGKFYLEGFGVDTDGLTYDSPVTRGFAANAVSKALFDELAVEQNMIKFADVPSDSKYAWSAYLLSNLGIMQGDGTNFNPENNITYNQAAKIFVSALGRDIEAQSKGGWPAGYTYVAAKIGLTDGVRVSGDDGLKFGDFAKMYYNFTDCKGFAIDCYNPGVYSQDDTTVLQYKLHRSNMKYLEGVVTGNQFGSAISDELGMISVENVSYDLACDISQDIVGYYVNVFLTYRDGRYVVTSVIVDPAMNRTKTLYEADIVSTGITEIKYYENGKKKTLKLNDVMVVRNDKVLNTITKKDLVPLNGGIVLVDNNRDGKYECVQIENRQYFIVSRISMEKNVLILDGGRYEGSTHLYINPDDNKFYHRIYNSNGEMVDFADITAEDVLRIEGSIGQDVMRVYIVDNVFDGKIESIAYDEDYPFTIDGKNYTIVKDVEHQPLIDMSEIRLGNVYTFTVDGERIVKIDKVKSDSVYGYVIDAYKESRNIYYTLVSEDQQVYSGKLADKIRYNGDRIDKRKFIPKSGVVISYRVDSDGNICSIEDAEVYMEKANKIYKKSTNILYSQTYEYPLFLSDKTVVFVVPDSGEEDDYMSDITLTDGKTYMCESYDYNDDDSSVSVVVVYGDFKYENPGYIYQNSPICILKDKKWVLDKEEDEFMCQLTWLEGTEEMSACIQDTQRMNNIVSKMAVGDVFQYAMTNRGFVNNVNILVMLDQNPEYFHNGAFSSVEQVYGRVVDAEAKVLPKGYVAEFVNIFTLDVGASANKSFLVSNNERKVSYYVFDSDSREVKAASIDDVMSEDGVLGTFNASEIFIYYYGTTSTPPDAMAVVIRN